MILRFLRLFGRTKVNRWCGCSLLWWPPKGSPHAGRYPARWQYAVCCEKHLIRLFSGQKA